MTATVVYLPSVARPARSVVAPRRPRSFWRKPWWWPVRYRADALRSLQNRLDGVEAALLVIGGAA